MEVQPITFDSDNVTSELSIICNNIPQDLSTIEKIRWIYMKMGKIFCYDYRVATDLSIGEKEVHLDDEFISRYQTCSQISVLFQEIVKNLVPECECEIINRPSLRRGSFANEHVASSITMPNKEKYLLDLTLDLYLIQSGCKTKNFGYDSDMYGTYDIIPLVDCVEMDDKLCLKESEKYTDDEIGESKEKIRSSISDFEPEDGFYFKMLEIQKLSRKFLGHHEAKMYLSKIINELLNVNSYEYNLTYKTEESFNMNTCFNFTDQGVNKWYIYDNVLGFFETNIDKLKEMLLNGWTTRSESLEQLLYEEESIIR